MLPERLTRYRVRSDSSSRDPSSIEAFEHSRERVYVEAANRSGDPETLRVLEQRLRGLRYERALRRARWAFMKNDLATAKLAAREAFQQRRTARSAMVLVGLGVASFGAEADPPGQTADARLVLPRGRRGARVRAPARR